MNQELFEIRQAERRAARAGVPEPEVTDETFESKATEAAMVDADRLLGDMLDREPDLTAETIAGFSSLTWDLAGSLAGVEPRHFVRKAVHRLAGEREAAQARTVADAFAGIRTPAWVKDGAS